MNAYIADSIARQHADSMLADAAAARRLRRARTHADRRSATRPATESAERVALPAPPRTGAAVAHAIASPFTAAVSWLAAGRL